MNKGIFKTFSIIAALNITAFSAISFAEPQNLSLLKQKVITYHDSGSYEKELALAIKKAQDYIVAQAELNEREANKKKLAIVLDIDETSLSNYNHMVARDFIGDRALIHQDILAADAPVIPPMLTLYKTAQKHGVRVFFVTGRPMIELDATKTNLLRAGFNHWAGLYLRPNTYNQPSITPFKAKARETISKKGYTIVASIGDQFSDLKGGYAQKGFKLPNPFYYLP